MADRRWWTRETLAAGCTPPITPATVSKHLTRARRAYATSGVWPVEVIPRPNSTAPLRWSKRRLDVAAWQNGPSRGGNRPRVPSLLLDEAWLRTQYEEGGSCASIGRKFQPPVASSTVRDALLRAGVKLRERKGWLGQRSPVDAKQGAA